MAILKNVRWIAAAGGQARGWAAAILLAMAGLVAAAPGGLAELQDVSVQADGARAQVRLTFAAPLFALEAQPLAEGASEAVRVRAPGLGVGPRWEFVPGSFVRAVRFETDEGGAVMVFNLDKPARGVSVAGGGRVWTLSLDFTAPARVPAGRAPLYDVGASLDASAPKTPPASTARAASSTPSRASSSAPQRETRTTRAASGAVAAPEAETARQPAVASPEAQRAETLALTLNPGLDTQTCEDARAAVADDPWEMGALQTHGACLALAQRGDEAADVFARILTFSPSDVEARLGLGVARAIQGAGDEARTLFSQALADSRGDAAAVRVRALLALAD